MQGRKMKPKTKSVCLHSIQAQVLDLLWNNQKILSFFLHSNFSHLLSSPVLSLSLCHLLLISACTLSQNLHTKSSHICVDR